MKVVIEDGFSKISRTGIGQYTMMLEKLFDELSFDIVNINKPFLSKIKNRFLRRILYNLWLNTIFIIKLILLKDEVTVICTNYSIPIFKHLRIKFIPVIHDLCMFKHPELSSRIINNYEKSNVSNAIKKAYKIIAVSNTVKNEIIQTFNNMEEKIFVVYNSCSTSMKSANIAENVFLEDKYNIQKQRYILSVATNNKRKNIAALVSAYKKISNQLKDIKLVLVGGNYNKPNNSKIIVTGYISDAELKCLYQNALLYVFPSVYEGFGIPIIDAQSFGVPVLCSDIPVFNEVGGESVEYFSLQTNDLIEKITGLINSEQKRNKLIYKGNENIKRFRYESIKSQINTVFKEVVYNE